MDPHPLSLDELRARHGVARHPERSPAHTRPPGMDDATVEAVGRVSAALEVAEHARGHLYAFHRLSGTADLELQAALDALRSAGHADAADCVAEVLIGRDVISDRWTFELVEDYDANYWSAFRDAERSLRAALTIEPHLFEAEMKLREQG